MIREWTVAPSVRIDFGGRPFDRGRLRALESVTVNGRLGWPTQCELQLDGDRLGELLPREWRIGTPLKVSVSAPEGDSSLFEGELVAIEQSYPPGGGKIVGLRAYDPLFRLHGRQSVRGLREMSVGELAQELVADLGLSVKKKSGAARRWTMQHRQTDLELLRAQCELAGVYPYVAGRSLSLLTLEGEGQVMRLEQGQTLLESRFDVGAASTKDSAVAYAWDPATGTAAEQEVRRPRAGRKKPWSRKASDAETLSLVDLALEDARQLEDAAQGALDRATCRELTFWGVAHGDARLRPGCCVDVRGVDPTLEGTFVLTSVRHRLDRAHGFVSEISSFPPAPVEAPTASAVVPGEVTSVKDPEKQGRVRATLPTFAGLETGWMRVISPGLGRHRGFVAIPDVGDQVAVALTHGDPARALVLGGIFDGRGSLDAGVEGGRVRRFQFRAGDQQVILDEEKGAIRLENQKGSYLELTPDGIRVHAAGNLILEAPGKRIRMGGGRIDMEKT
ncbi:MAG: phage baseplate assembly protein V [Acidobacteriota bacterium]